MSPVDDFFGVSLSMHRLLVFSNIQFYRAIARVIFVRFIRKCDRGWKRSSCFPGAPISYSKKRVVVFGTFPQKGQLDPPESRLIIRPPYYSIVSPVFRRPLLDVSTFIRGIIDKQ